LPAEASALVPLLAPICAAILLLVGLVMVGRHTWLGGRAWAVFGLVLLVRLVVVPAWSLHQADGHEADYLDLFLGTTRPSGVPDPTRSPTAEWLTWLAGQVLPADPRVPVVLMALTAAIGIGALSFAIAALANPAAGWCAALVLALHPAHAAWSTSLYPVMLAWTLCAVALYGVACWTSSAPGPDSPPVPGRAGFLWLAAGALPMAVAVRPDAIAVVAWLALLLVVRKEADDKLFVTMVSGVALGLTALVLVVPLSGEVPGEGEALLAWRSQVLWSWPYWPFIGIGPMLLLAFGGVAASRRWPRPTLAVVGGGVAHHLLLSAFDDRGERHALLSLLVIAWCLGAGAASLLTVRPTPLAARRADPYLPKPRVHPVALALGASLLLTGMSLEFVGLRDLRGRYYASPEQFAAVLDAPPWSSLPRWTLGAHSPDPRRDPNCGWVGEDPRIAATPATSHFNLLSEVEADALRGPDGCLRWCFGEEDYRWSSRAVRDRAQRLAWLYTLRPLAVLTDPLGGARCLVVDVGARKLAIGLAPDAAVDGGGPWSDVPTLP
jgi:hypothetical protein